MIFDGFSQEIVSPFLLIFSMNTFVEKKIKRNDVLVFTAFTIKIKSDFSYGKVVSLFVKVFKKFSNSFQIVFK